jgi:hypothetical protein
LLLLCPLARAATLHVVVHRNAARGPLVVALIPNDDSRAATAIATRELSAQTSDATFDGVGAGSYLVLVKGQQPLERISAQSVVAANDRRVINVAIPRRLADVRITLGGAPLARAEVTFTRSAPRWETTATTDANGEIRSAIWEEGGYIVGVRGAGLRAPVIRAATLAGSPASLGIDIPTRFVRGRIVDRSGRPMQGVTVALRTTANEIAPLVRQMTDADGVFEFVGVLPGPQTVRALPIGYLRPDPIELDLAEAETSREVDFVLDRGDSRPVSVVDAHGDPVDGAMVVCADDGAVRSETFTDARGAAVVAMPAERSTTIYVFPRDGSMAIQRLPAQSAERARIVIPKAAASLRINTLATDGAPISDVSLLMRVNGEIVPPDVAHALERQQGLALQTNEQGVAALAHIPPGTYEFWPYRGEREAEALLDTCFDVIANCSPLIEPALATEWSVASVEVKQTTPKGQKVTRTVQTAVPVRAAVK